MANYKDIQGKTVKSYTSDPSNSYGAGFEGQLYYNSSDGQFKYQTLGVGAWASGGNLNTAGRNRGGAGTNTAALVFGGLPAPKAITESCMLKRYAEILNVSRTVVRNVEKKSNQESEFFLLPQKSRQTIIRRNFQGIRKKNEYY